MEECLTLNELRLLLDAAGKIEHRHHRFMGMLKGIDIDESDEKSVDARFDDVKIRANAQLLGKTPEAHVLEDIIGIDFITDEEDEVT